MSASRSARLSYKNVLLMMCEDGTPLYWTSYVVMEPPLLGTYIREEMDNFNVIAGRSVGLLKDWRYIDGKPMESMHQSIPMRRGHTAQCALNGCGPPTGFACIWHTSPGLADRTTAFKSYNNKEL